MQWMFLPFVRYGEFSGRSQRKEIWMFGLLNLWVWAVVFVLGPESRLVVALFLLYFFASVIPGLAVQVRRFHDQDMSGWWVLLGAVPYAGGVGLLLFNMVDGTPGPNRYGADPKGRGGGDADS